MPTVGGSPGGAYYVFFSTVNPSSGASVNADSLPTALAFKNAVDDHVAFPLTVANVSTGLYKVTGTIPSGYTGGDSVSVVISATVTAVVGVKVVDEFVVAPANYFSAVIDVSGRVDVGKIAGQTANAAGAVTFPGTIASTTNITAGTITTTTNLTNLPAITTDWISAAGVSALAVNKIQTGLATPTNITAGTITTVTNLTNAPTAGDFTSTMKTSIGTAVTAVADKTGYSLSANGLDLITATDPGGVASTFPQMVVQLWRLFFKKSVKAVSGLTIKTYADNGTTVRTTQPYTDDGAGNQTRDAAT